VDRRSLRKRHEYAATSLDSVEALNVVSWSRMQRMVVQYAPAVCAPVMAVRVVVVEAFCQTNVVVG
jgi:hypothetical protein